MSVARSVADVLSDTRDFGIGRALKNLPHLRRIGFQANRRLRGIVKRLPHSHRYGLTPFGLRTALFWTRSYELKLAS